MYVIIAGAGKVGWNLARELIAKDSEVTVIPRQQSVVTVHNGPQAEDFNCSGRCEAIGPQNAAGATPDGATPDSSIVSPGGITTSHVITPHD